MTQIDFTLVWSWVSSHTGNHNNGKRLVKGKGEGGSFQVQQWVHLTLSDLLISRWTFLTRKFHRHWKEKTLVTVNALGWACANNEWQESIPVGCQPPACRAYMLHNEQGWTCAGGEGGPCTVNSKLNMFEHVRGPCTMRSKLNKSGGSLYRVSRAGPRKWGWDQGPIQEGPCMVMSNTSWVMATWDPHLPLLDRMMDRRDWKH